VTPRPQVPGDGLVFEITDAVIDPEVGVLTVTFYLTDEDSVPVAPVLESTDREDEARVRFTLAHIEDFSGGAAPRIGFTKYVNDVNPSHPGYDSDGVLTVVDRDRGIYTYEFATSLPDGFDTAATYTVAAQGDRSVAGRGFGANPVFDFVPAGGDPEIRAGSTTARCNTCHDPLRFHGNRTEFRLCTTCHTRDFVGRSGESMAMGPLIHRVHRGRDLPSGNDPEGTAFPRDIRECETCHADGVTAELHEQAPSALDCTGCHDDVNPSLEETAAGPPGTNHLGGQGFEDGECTFCHEAESDTEFDLSVMGAHTVPEQSVQLAGLNVEILDVTNHAAGDRPTVMMRVDEDDGTVIGDLEELGSFSMTFGGPTVDYAETFRASVIGRGASGQLSGPDASGVYRYTPDEALPDDATGTWSVGIEARRTVEISGRSVTEAAVNPVVDFAVDDGPVVPRRRIVDDAKCGSCHGEFSRGFNIHGSLRNRVDYCVVCHNANATDAARRSRDPDAVAIGDDNQTIDFKVMIHKIHTGEDLSDVPYLIYGFGQDGFSVNDFSDVLFPGDRRNCATCHVDGTYMLPPFPGAALATRMTSLDPASGEEVEEGVVPPITSVCTSCHDGEGARAHAATQTSPDGEESCTVCHSEGRSVAVSEAHAR